MTRRKTQFAALLAMILLLSGCGYTGQKTANLSIVYGCMAVLSFVLLVACGWTVKKSDPWLLLLFASVFVVNTGYFALSVSANLMQALWANRVAYLGSVFLPAAMLLIMLNVTDTPCPKWLPTALLVLGIPVFLVAASPGYLNIYYKEVSFAVVNGVSVLQKVYGPWHILYLFYLLGYFCAMVGVTVQALVKRKMDTVAQALVLVFAVFANIGVWLIEQMVRIDFEILSVSYIISALFLLGLHFMMQEHTKLQEELSRKKDEASGQGENAVIEQVTESNFEQFRSGLQTLTKTEQLVYECYIAGKTTKQIMEELNIKENTLKFHNKNLYGKLGVNSRKQLLEICKFLENNP